MQGSPRVPPVLTPSFPTRRSSERAGTEGVIGNSPAGFMTANADEAGVITTQSGLQYKVLEEGEGDSPTADDVALINYTGMLTDGEVFDQNERAPLPVDG